MVTRLKHDRKVALTAFASVGRPGEEEGLGLVQMSDHLSGSEDVPYLDGALDRQRRKLVGERDTQPVVQSARKKRPRGKPFARGHDPRRWLGARVSRSLHV